MPRFKGRQRGSKNRPREALPLVEALKELESRTPQTVPMTEKYSALPRAQSGVRSRTATFNQSEWAD